jgi:hypothetical protein
LNLLGKEDTGTQLFSITQILKAQELAKEKEAFQESEIARKAAKRAQQAKNKELKEVESIRKAEERAQEEANKQLNQEALREAKKNTPKRGIKGKKKSLSIEPKTIFTLDQSECQVQFAKEVEIIGGKEGSVIRGRLGRQILLPTRFKD